MEHIHFKSIACTKLSLTHLEKHESKKIKSQTAGEQTSDVDTTRKTCDKKCIKYETGAVRRIPSNIRTMT